MTEHLLLSQGAYALTQVFIRWRRNRGEIDATTDWVPPGDGGGEMRLILFSDFLHYFFPVPDDGFSFLFPAMPSDDNERGGAVDVQMSSSVRRPP